MLETKCCSFTAISSYLGHLPLRGGWVAGHMENKVNSARLIAGAGAELGNNPEVTET
jgi:hypothetical protein